MDLQTAFSTIYKGMKEQGAYALTHGNSDCEYITNCGLKCAVGQLATNNEQAEIWEEQGISSDEIARIVGIEHPKAERLLSVIQAEHDEAAKDAVHFDVFLSDLKAIGALFGLTT